MTFKQWQNITKLNLSNIPQNSMVLMLERYLKVRLQVENVLNKIHDAERDKKKKGKIANLRLSEVEKQKCHELVEALNYVKTASQRLCGNDVTLSAADRVSAKLARCNSSYTYPHMSNEHIFI